ncbi:MAG: glycosyltransferase family 2 protein [Pseudomonadota bacterium]
MKLIVQIPCFNEAETLPQTVADIPRQVPGFDRVEVLIVDDGSTDGTADVAARIGVDHVIRHPRNMGLARTFARGLRESLIRGADVIVNTDGDNQYAGDCIRDLVAPILAGEADIAIGDRGTDRIDHFSPLKRLLQRSGSRVVRTISGLQVEDAVSGFRAYSREAALSTNVLSEFSYTIETLIQAGNNGIAVVSVPVRTNPVTRESRLFKSIPSFLSKQLITLLRSYVMYYPLRVFTALGVLLVVAGSLPVLRFLWFFAQGDGDGKLQSLVIGGVFVVVGFITLTLALLADAVAMNRRLLEQTLRSVRRLELDALGAAAARGGHEPRAPHHRADPEPLEAVEPMGSAAEAGRRAVG